MNKPLLRSGLERLFLQGRRVSLAVVSTIVALAALPHVTAAQTAGDSAAVASFVDAYRTTWNSHDPSALAALFTPDADMIMGTDPVSLGRQGIQEWWREYFGRQEPDRGVVIAIHRMRLIRPDVVLLNVATTTGGRTEQGEQLRSREARGMWVVVREGGTWHISAMRGMPTEQDEIIRSAGGRVLRERKQGESREKM
jgi:uncharacterized protein (TIGR02246 family)